MSPSPVGQVSPSPVGQVSPSPVGCDRQSFESRRYRDSLEGTDFANKLSRFEHLVTKRSGPPIQARVYTKKQYNTQVQRSVRY